MTAAANSRNMGSWRRTLVVALYGALVVGGLLLGRQLIDLTEILLHWGDEVFLRRIVVTTIIVYIVMAALPFVPAAEIGLILMLMIGPETAALVYAGTVFALMLAFLVGRAVPAGASAAVFDLFGFRRARDLVRDMAVLEADARLGFLLAHAPKRMIPTLLRHRYLSLAFALNLPGNSLIGGGGGIALVAGMSGLYPIPAYVATVAIAVAPVPLFIALSPLVR